MKLIGEHPQIKKIITKFSYRRNPFEYKTVDNRFDHEKYWIDFIRLNN